MFNMYIKHNHNYYYNYALCMCFLVYPILTNPNCKFITIINECYLGVTSYVQCYIITTYGNYRLKRF